MEAATLSRPSLAEHTTEETAVHETNGHGEPEISSAASEVDAPAKDPIPPPTPAELRASHYAEIVAESVNVEQSRLDFEESNAETKRLKKEYEGRQALFLRLTRRDPLQRTLIPDTPIENVEPLPVDDSWRKLPVSELDIAEHIVGKLDGHGINTLGDLQDYWKAGKHLRDFKGIGESAETCVVDAFSEYGAQHPEVFGDKPATEESDGDDQDSLNAELRDEFDKRGILAK